MSQQLDSPTTLAQQTPRAPGALSATVITTLGPADILTRLDHASRRGRLPGFSAKPSDDILFTLELHGTPFDGILAASARDGSSTEIACHGRMLWTMPAIFAAVLILTVWPGVYFMDRFLPDWQWIPRIGTWWPATWWWYIPLTLLPLPFVWRELMRRSRKGLSQAMDEAVEKIARETDGRIA